MKNKKKKILLSAILFCIFSICFITSYAFFNFSKETNEEITTTGDIYMKLESSEDNIVLTNNFPETKTKAELRSDNYIDFTVKGMNTGTKPIYYQIDTVYGDIPTGYDSSDRMNDIDIMIELIDLNTNEVLVLEKYSNLDNNTIYVKSIQTSIEVEDKYRLRIWINENTLISDTDPNKDYCSSIYCDDSTKGIFKELFTSLKINVYGDLETKVLYNVMGTLPETITNEKANIKEVYFINDTESNIETRYNSATIKADITNTDNTVGSSEIKNLTTYGKVLAWLEAIDETYYKLYIGANGYTYLSTGAYLFQDFYNVTKYDLTNLRTNYATSLRDMFHCDGTNPAVITSLDVSNFVTSNVTDMRYMFNNLSSLTSLDVSNFDTSKVITFSYMFAGCSSLTSLDVSNFDTSSLTALQATFYNCTNLININLSNWDVSNVTKTKSLFSGCTNLTSVNMSNWDTSKVEDMYQMFYNCKALTKIDLSSFNTSLVTTMQNMFNNCTNLITIYIGSNWSTSGITETNNGSGMFTGCTNLKGGNGTLFDASNVDYTFAVNDTSATPGYLTLK